jgi:hypothetical protein
MKANEMHYFSNLFDKVFYTFRRGPLSIIRSIKQYQKKWLQHVQRMDTNRIPNKHYNIEQKDEEHRTTEEEMEGPTSS